MLAPGARAGGSLPRADGARDAIPAPPSSHFPTTLQRIPHDSLQVQDVRRPARGGAGRRRRDLRLLPHPADPAPPGRRAARQPLRPRQPLPPRQRVRQGHARVRGRAGRGPLRRRGVLVGGAVPLRRGVRARPRHRRAGAHGQPHAGQLHPGRRGLPPGPLARGRGAARHLRAPGPGHRGHPGGHRRGCRQGGALRCLHLLQGERRPRPAHARQREGRRALPRAHHRGLPRVLRAHHAGGQAGPGLRALHLLGPAERQGDGGGGVAPRAPQRPLGAQRVGPLPGPHQGRRQEDPDPGVLRHGPLRPARGVRPPAGAGHDQAGLRAGPGARHQEDLRQGREACAGCGGRLPGAGRHARPGGLGQRGRPAQAHLPLPGRRRLRPRRRVRRARARPRPHLR